MTQEEKSGSLFHQHSTVSPAVALACGQSHGRICHRNCDGFRQRLCGISNAQANDAGIWVAVLVRLPAACDLRGGRDGHRCANYYVGLWKVRWSREEQLSIKGTALVRLPVVRRHCGDGHISLVGYLEVNYN
jgi:hypothetical protein